MATAEPLHLWLRKRKDRSRAKKMPNPFAPLTSRSDERRKPMKIARILDRESGTFELEYDNTQGKKNLMRLDALSYEKAIREAKSFLGIDEANCDEDGTLWEVE